MFSNAIWADAWVVHIPHSSTVIPADARAKLLLSDQELALELLRMTDHLTDELVHSALTMAPRIRFSKIAGLMSALGQKRTCAAHKPMSAKCQ
jgi:hypothetical protein